MKILHIVLISIIIVLVIAFALHVNNMKKNYVKINKPKDGEVCALSAGGNYGIIKDGVCK